jgi:hypothetical protein
MGIGKNTAERVKSISKFLPWLTAKPAEISGRTLLPVPTDTVHEITRTQTRNNTNYVLEQYRVSILT